MPPRTTEEIQFFSPTLRQVIIGLLFITAFGVRLYRINEFPRNLDPGRPYHSIIIARGYYFEKLKSIPEWRRQVASINKKQTSVGEPRIIEHLAAFAYQIAGGEYLWIPQLFSSIFWLTGAGALYLLVKKLLSADAAVFSILFYLFLPYAVSASRSFLPHPLMVMMLMFGLLAIFRYYEQPSTPRLVLAAVLSALAMFTYPSALFPIYGAFVSLALYKYGVRKAIISPKFLLFAVITLLPLAIHYAYNLFSAAFLQGYIHTSLTPGILLQSFFWKGWFNQIENIVGFPALIGGLIGVFMFREGPVRTFVIGLWAGYLVYALIFNYHNATHPYYQIILIPIVALSLGPIGAQVSNCLSKTCNKWSWHLPILALVVLAIILHVYRIRQQMFNPNFEYEVRIAEQIGGVVGHSTRTILLTRFYMFPFKYHAEVSGTYWPSQGDFRAAAMRGERIPTAEERFNTQYLKDDPQYFIVTDYYELQMQTDLRNFLVRNFPVLTQNPNYLIFDLRKPLKMERSTDN